MEIFQAFACVGLVCFFWFSFFLKKRQEENTNETLREHLRGNLGEIQWFLIGFCIFFSSRSGSMALSGNLLHSKGCQTHPNS